MTGNDIDSTSELLEKITKVNSNLVNSNQDEKLDKSKVEPATCRNKYVDGKKMEVLSLRSLLVS